ncbi:Riboflavin kinase [Armadillidium nasatum]|uniref:Riboflavin kinase n=1 Tax=Armadillidium nasatum TaxID=96803 RepID=A0A5N5TGY5_9CRUS|nr:Riboflavin kinase [Armadillidium nasatum]
MAFKFLPLYVFGKVVKGFGRGSKELGIPTANLSEEVIDLLPKDVNPGIYYGLASVNKGPTYKMVLSVGWNPFYHNEKKSLETHILHEFEDDFYGSVLKIILIGYIRPEKNFSSLDELITEIKSDISIAETKLDEPVYKKYYISPFWSANFEEEKGVFFSDNFKPTSHSGSDNDVLLNGKL